MGDKGLGWLLEWDSVDRSSAQEGNREKVLSILCLCVLEIRSSLYLGRVTSLLGFLGL